MKEHVTKLGGIDCVEIWWERGCLYGENLQDKERFVLE